MQLRDCARRRLRKAELSVNEFDTLRALREHDHELAAFLLHLERCSTSSG